MTNLSKLTKTQLGKILADTQSELKRRDGIASAEKEIRAILKKYSITLNDIDLGALKSGTRAGRSPNSSKGGGRKKDQRASVAAKFKNPNSADTWTGRGRAPKWVANLCDSEGITVDAFKQDARFLIK
jgi:DNA-binding protein H-NS